METAVLFQVLECWQHFFVLLRSVIDVKKEILTNETTGKSYTLNSLGEVIEIIRAGNIFEYARQSGLI